MLIVRILSKYGLRVFGILGIDLCLCLYKKEPTPVSSQNKKEPIIENGISSTSFNLQENYDFGLMDHKIMDHLIQFEQFALKPKPFCTNEIVDETHKILDFKYK